jgi:hypothetical protein
LINFFFLIFYTQGKDFKTTFATSIIQFNETDESWKKKILPNYNTEMEKIKKSQNLYFQERRKTDEYKRNRVLLKRKMKEINSVNNKEYFYKKKKQTQNLEKFLTAPNVVNHVKEMTKKTVKKYIYKI